MTPGMMHVAAALYTEHAAPALPRADEDAQIDTPNPDPTLKPLPWLEPHTTTTENGLPPKEEPVTA